MTRQRGFSLFEVLVALSLTSLLLLSLYSTLAVVGRSNRAVAAAQRETQDRRLVSAALRSLLAQAVPLTERRDERTHVLFAGTPSSVRWVTHLPSHAGGGGLQFVEIRADAGRLGRRNSLRLAFRAAWPETRFDTPATDGGWAEESLLVDVDGVELEYFGAESPGSKPRWHDTWAGEDLPQLVRLVITGDDAWPPLVAPLRARVSEAMPNWYREPVRAL